MSAPIVVPVVLVYREGKGCRQYPFNTVEEFEAFAARHPYRNEYLRLIPIKGRQFLPAVVILPGDGANGAAFLRKVLS